MAALGAQAHPPRGVEAPARGDVRDTADVRARPWLAHLPAVAIGLLWFAVASWIAVAEHQTYNTTSRDFGVYLQVLWNGAHGRPFQTTLLESNRVHLAEHVALLLPLLGPGYAAVPDPRWLLVLQQAALALSGVPVYLLARRVLGRGWLPTLVAAAFYAMPTLVEVALDAFYPVTFTALPVAFAAYFLLTDRVRRAVACAVVALVLEEEAGLMVLGLGAFGLLRPGARRWGVALLAIGVAWLLALALVVMPRFHDPSTVPAAENRTVSHFDALRRDPAGTLGALLTERAGPAARWWLLPTGGVALLAPEVLLIDAPHAATLLLADKEGRFRRHWAAPMLPVLWMATVVGLARLRRPGLRAVGMSLLLVGSVAAYWADSGLPGGGDWEPEDVVWTDRAEQLDHLVRQVPPGAPVGASRRVLGHLADRPELYVFPPSYAGRLWPPERRLQTYVLDLTNDQTWEALAGRQSPLRAGRPYAIWLAGPDAMLLTERPPGPTVAVGRDLGDLRLVGYDSRLVGASLELTLHWVAPSRPGGPLTRVVRQLDAAGAVVAEQRGTALDGLFPTSEWPGGQVVLDRVRLGRAGELPVRVEVGWAGTDGTVNRLELTVGDAR